MLPAELDGRPSALLKCLTSTVLPSAEMSILHTPAPSVVAQSPPRESSAKLVMASPWAACTFR